MSKKICVIIPMYGFPEMTKECIDYVLKNAGIDCDILVVDDGSPVCYCDGRVNVLRLDKNGGFTSAINQGILWCRDKYKYIHLLNNDTLPEPNFLKELYDVMEGDWHIAVAGSIRIVTHNEEFKYECYGADLIRGFQIASKTIPPIEIMDIHWIPFCSVMLSHKAIRYLGLLDPLMVNHCSDNDWCLRARTNGWRVVMVSKSQVQHVHEVTTKHHKCFPETDQKRMLEKITGAIYIDIFSQLPVDCEQQTYGRITFETYKKPLRDLQEEKV